VGNSLLAGDAAAIGFGLIGFGAAEAVIVTDNEREAVNNLPVLTLKCIYWADGMDSHGCECIIIHIVWN
jgi:hypothetical protein